MSAARRGSRRRVTAAVVRGAAGDPAGLALARLLDDLVAGGDVVAVAGVVATPDRVLWSGAAGWERRRPLRPLRPAPPARVGTRFDLASLTKPVMATLALALDRPRAPGTPALPLGLEVGEIWPRAARTLARRTLEDLLRHRAGFLPWTPLYARCRDRRAARALLLGGDLLGARPRTYSDLGYALWGMCAERALGLRLRTLVRRHLARPLGLGGLAAPGRRVAVAACPLDNAREVELAAAQGIAVARRSPPPPGVVQDGNARFLGGLAGHAGLFAAAGDLVRLGGEWLRPRRLLRPAAVAAALAGDDPLLGWRARRTRNSAGRALSPGAFGHVGFTGGSLWIDPAARRIFVMLAHRTSPHAELAAARRRFHALAQRL